MLRGFMVMGSRSAIFTFLNTIIRALGLCGRHEDIRVEQPSTELFSTLPSLLRTTVAGGEWMPMARIY
jgi:hypothetical protein